MPFLTPFDKNKPRPSHGSPRRIEKGALENARTSLLAVLGDRFGAVPDDLPGTLNLIDDPQQLTTLMRIAVKTPSLKEFLNVLKG